MSRAYKCDICNSFYDENSVCSDGYINPRLVKNNTNYIRLRSGSAYLVKYDSGVAKTDVYSDFADICPDCTARLQRAVDDILREEIRQNNAETR